MLTSTHKIAGSLTQSAMLHVGDSGRVDVGAVARALRLLRSTSPSSLLIASLDGARRQLALHGEQLLHETLEAIEVARAKLETIPGIALVDASLVGRMGVAGYDPLRIVLDVRGTGRTGYEIADALRRSYDVHVELPMQATVVFVVGLGESAADAAAAGRRRRRGRQAPERAGRDGADRAARRRRCATRWRCRRARRSSARPSRSRSTTRSAGSRASRSPATRRACPALLPGERISAETVAYLRELAASGARLHGASDPAFQTINVLREARVIDPLERWAQYGEKPDYAGLLTFAGAPYTQDPAELEGFDVAIVGAPMDDLVSDRPGARFAPRAIRAASCPPGPHLEVEGRRVRRAAGRRLRRRAGHPRRPRRARTRRSRRPSAQVLARRRAPGRARRRPLDHRAVRCARARPRTARSAWSTSTPTPTPAPRCSASSARTARSCRRLVDDGHVDGAPLRPDRPARLLAGRGRVRLAGRARHHEPVHARRPRPRHPRGRARARSRRSAPGPVYLTVDVDVLDPAFLPAAPARPSPAA